MILTFISVQCNDINNVGGKSCGTKLEIYLLWLVLGAQSAALSTCQGNYIVFLGKIPTLVSPLSTLECEWLLKNC